MAVITAYAWLLGGDYNAVPSECPLRYLLDPFEIMATGQSTRWDGHRCIDYFLANRFIGSPVVPALTLADHKVIELRLPSEERRLARGKEVQPTPKLPAFEGSVELWHETLEEIRSKVSDELPSRWTHGSIMSGLSFLGSCSAV